MTTYPTREEHTRQWEELAAAIAAAPLPSEDVEPLPEGAPRGSLTVLGSGIQGLAFTMDCEAKIRNADRVFYCVSNPPTQVWLRSIRPDAFDLYVFYDDTKPRYHTYVQMSEAMLHPVRQGLNVVAIYYGHPGIFVLSTHRSIEIARREGHRAEMKAGVSALDCLCADLGVDPSYPGMQTFEATEVLLRKRPLDTSLHMVLWQVGLIGEVGYRRKGFINDNFPVLVEYLNDYYGPDHPVTHYIAARFPSFDPTISVHCVSELDDPLLRPAFTGISTFYLPPKDAAFTDIDMAVRLGLAPPGSTPMPRTKVRKTALYGKRELEALAGFHGFRVPDAFQYQERTRAAEFFIEMTTNPALEEAYRTDPGRALSDESFPGLSETERMYLAFRDENFVQVAAKGSRVKVSPNEKLVNDLYSSKQIAGSFREQLIAAYRGTITSAEVNAWIERQSPGADLVNFVEANERVNASSLLPWTGVYCSNDGSFVLTVIGSPSQNAFSSVYVGATLIKRIAFNNSTLSWQAEDGNPSTARIRFNMPDRSVNAPFRRTCSGRYWAAGADEPATTNVDASEIPLEPRPMADRVGRYLTELSTDGATWRDGPTITMRPLPGRGHPAPVTLTVDGVELAGVAANDSTVSWSGGQITFSASEFDTSDAISGLLSGSTQDLYLRGHRDGSWAEVFHGTYIVWRHVGGRWTRAEGLAYVGPGLRLGDVDITDPTFADNKLDWFTAAAHSLNGSLQFMLDPATGSARFIGTAWGDGAQPSSPNILGLSEPRVDDSDAIPVTESTALPIGVWETLAAVASEVENPAAYFLWSRIRRAQVVCRFVNRLALDIVERLH